MKKIARAFVAALALTGAAASLYTSTASAQRTTPKPGSLPIPMCPPNDPNHCGMGQ